MTLPVRSADEKGDVWWKSLNKQGKIATVRPLIETHHLTNTAIQSYLGLSSTNMVVNARNNMNIANGHIPVTGGNRLRTRSTYRPATKKPEAALKKEKPAVVKQQTRSNLPQRVIFTEKKKQEAQRLPYVSRPVQNYPLGDRLSPFPSPTYGPDGVGLAEIVALQSLYK